MKSIASESFLMSSRNKRCNQQDHDYFDVRSAIAKNSRIYGRDKEIAEIRAAYNRVVASGNHDSEILLISGNSGTGKSTLAMSALKTMCNKDDAMICSGKFDQSKTLRPFSAVMDALEQLCNLISDRTSQEQMQCLVAQYIASSDLSILIETIPNFGDALGRDFDLSVTEATNKDMVNSIHGFTRLQRSLRSFLYLASTLGPVVLFIDDLQWADESSLDLLSSFLKDSIIKGLLITGCYRHKEVDQSHILTQTVNKLRNERITVTEITAGDLDVDSLNSFVSDSLTVDPDLSMGLTTVIHRKTNGNIYFCIQFLELLNQMGILERSIMTLQWTWDSQKITEMNALENVVEILVNRIKALPDEERNVLIIGSCFGNRFNVNLLLMVLAQYEAQQQDGDDRGVEKSKNAKRVNRLLDERYIDAVDAQVETDLPKFCKFSHDRVQQAAYSIIEEEKKSLMHYRIGCDVLKVVESPKAEEWMNIVAVDQLNKGLKHVCQSKVMRFKVAKMNLEAAHELKRKSAFLSASQFLRICLELLGPERWKDHYDVALDACSLCAQLDYSVGHFEESNYRVDEIRLFARCKEDMLEAEWTSIQCSIAKLMFDEALSKAYSVVNSLGEKYPKRPSLINVLLEYRKVRKLIAGKSEKEMIQLSERPLKESRRLQVLRFLVFVGLCAFYAGRDLDIAMISLRVCKISFLEGFSQYTALGLSGICPILIVTSNDFKLASVLGNVAVQLIDHFGVRDLEARLLVPLLGIPYSFKHPYRNQLKLLNHGYRIGIAAGDMESSQCLQQMSLSLSFLCGTSLNLINDRFQLAIEEIVEYRQTLSLIQMRSLHQVIQNLLGLNSDPKVLAGQVVPDLKTLLKQGTAVSRERNTRITVSHELYLAVFFDKDLTMAKAKAKELAAFKDKDYPFWYSIFFPFLRGLVWVSLVRKGKQKYHRRAMLELRKLELWAKQGCVNAHHMYAIMKAEVASTSASESADEIRTLYYQAINSARRSSMIPHQALASERAGEYFESQGDVDASRLFLREAMKLYSEWGCQLKVTEISKRYGLDASEAVVQHHGSSITQDVAVVRSLYSSRNLIEVTGAQPFEKQGVERSSVGNLKRRLQRSSMLMPSH